METTIILAEEIIPHPEGGCSARRLGIEVVSQRTRIDLLVMIRFDAHQFGQHFVRVTLIDGDARELFEVLAMHVDISARNQRFVWFCQEHALPLDVGAHELVLHVDDVVEHRTAIEVIGPLTGADCEPYPFAPID